VTSGNTLGGFLKARRGQLKPADVGLSDGSRRRVPGLRREELAGLAGISSDYYLRIEQGRVEHPSAQVVTALARALRLDDTSTAHLHALAGTTAADAGVDDDRLAPGLADLVDQLAVPALVVGRYLDCLASNSVARMLSPNFSPGRNLLRQLLFDPAERDLHVDWEEATAGIVGGLRQVAGTAPSDPRLGALVDEFSRRSDWFATVWARADVGFRPAGTSHMRHPRVGELHLNRQRFDIPGSALHLHLYYAASGSDSEHKLAELRSRMT